MLNARAAAIALLAVTACERADTVEPTTTPIELPSESSPVIAQVPMHERGVERTGAVVDLYLRRR